MRRDALIDGKFRYWLSRVWDDTLPTVTFICLNPSTADDKNDDRTILKCIKYATRWGKGGLFVVNLFAFVDTNQTNIWNESDPIGPENDKWLMNLAFKPKPSVVIAAWGDDGWRFDRSAIVCQLLPNMHCLQVNKSGEPHHPLYLSPDLKPKPYNRHVVRGSVSLNRNQTAGLVQSLGTYEGPAHAEEIMGAMMTGVWKVAFYQDDNGGLKCKCSLQLHDEQNGWDEPTTAVADVKVFKGSADSLLDLKAEGSFSDSEPKWFIAVDGVSLTSGSPVGTIALIDMDSNQIALLRK